MELFPIRTKKIVAGDDLASLLRDGEKETDFSLQDILVISSKAVATAEGRILKIGSMKPSGEALGLAQESGLSAEFCEAVLVECEAWNGRVIHTCPGAVLTELRPAKMQSGTILIANAGLDQSNIGEGYAVGWPIDPAESAQTLRQTLETQMRSTKSQISAFAKATADKPNPKQISKAKLQNTPPTIAVIISDSCCTPRRSGVTAFALAVSGIDPVQSVVGKPDLFGKPLKITNEAVADQLATAANALMGNAGRSIPAVLIRNHGFPLSHFEGWVPGISPTEDLFPV